LIADRHRAAQHGCASECKLRAEQCTIRTRPHAVPPASACRPDFRLRTTGADRKGGSAVLCRQQHRVRARGCGAATSAAASGWSALATAGLPEIHLQRHTGNVLAASAGASLGELMARMRHASARAALVYLHDTEARQRTIAAIGDLARKELRRPTDDAGS
jgi:hypothetical protein